MRVARVAKTSIAACAIASAAGQVCSIAQADDVAAVWASALMSMAFAETLFQHVRGGGSRFMLGRFPDRLLQCKASLAMLLAQMVCVRLCCQL